MCSFPRAANVSHRFLKDNSKVSVARNDLFEKTSDVDWNDGVVPDDGQLKALNSLRDRLTSTLILALPNIGRPYMIDCHASQNVIGVLLLQQQKWVQAKGINSNCRLF